MRTRRMRRVWKALRGGPHRTAGAGAPVEVGGLSEAREGDVGGPACLAPGPRGSVSPISPREVIAGHREAASGSPPRGVQGLQPHHSARASAPRGSPRSGHSPTTQGSLHRDRTLSGCSARTAASAFTTREAAPACGGGAGGNRAGPGRVSRLVGAAGPGVRGCVAQGHTDTRRPRAVAGRSPMPSASQQSGFHFPPSLAETALG